MKEKQFVKKWQNCQTIKTEDEFFVLIIGNFCGNEERSLGAYWAAGEPGHTDFPNSRDWTSPLLIPIEFIVPILIKVRNKENKKIIDKFLQELLENTDLIYYFSYFLITLCSIFNN